MTTTYNVNIVGGLTNTYGVLSDFSASNYATTPRSFTFGSYDWEFNIGFKTGDNVSTDQNVVTPLADGADKDAVNIWVNTERILVIICDANNGQTILMAEIPCSARTNYYIKCQYINGVYYIKQSSDGITYTNAVTPLTSTTLIWDTNQKWVFGCARGQNRPFYGTIDLNYCYLKINNAIVWRGVTETSQVITHIQLRRDISSTWATINPVLLEGEVGIETDTKKQKIGDGSTPWNSLAYDLGSTALQNITNSDVTNALGYTPVNIAGDTMTGILDINLSDTSHSYESLRLIDGDVTYNTAPLGARGLSLRFLDKNKQLMGFIGSIRYPSNSTAIRFFCRNANGQSGEAELIGNSSNQFEFHIPTPANNSDSNAAATTEWVRQQGYISTTEVFIATYGATSFSDIQAAYNADKSVFVKDNNLLVPLINYVASRASFRGIDRGSGANNFRCVEITATLDGSSTTWDKSTYQLELTTNKVTLISSSSTNTQYPSARCVYDSCVIKSGDTMTGNLNFSSSGQGTIGLNGISTSSYADITYKDGSNNRLAHLRAYNDSSTKRRAELVVMNDNGSPAGNGVRVTYENSTESCEFPNTKCVDGQAIASYLLVDNTKTVHSASADLSSYINDSTSASYEVLVEVNIASNNTTNLWVGNVADPYTNKHGNAFCIGTSTTSGGTQAHLACWVPLATSSRTLYYQLAGSSASNTADVNLLGYRRLGTNS